MISFFFVILKIFSGSFFFVNCIKTGCFSQVSLSWWTLGIAIKQHFFAIKHFCFQHFFTSKHFIFLAMSCDLQYCSHTNGKSWGISKTAYNYYQLDVDLISLYFWWTHDPGFFYQVTLFSDFARILT